MVIFHSYVKLPEGTQDKAKLVNDIASDVLAAHINIYILYIYINITSATFRNHHGSQQYDHHLTNVWFPNGEAPEKDCEMTLSSMFILICIIHIVYIVIEIENHRYIQIYSNTSIPNNRYKMI